MVKASLSPCVICSRHRQRNWPNKAGLHQPRPVLCHCAFRPLFALAFHDGLTNVLGAGAADSNDVDQRANEGQ